MDMQFAYFMLAFGASVIIGVLFVGLVIAGLLYICRKADHLTDEDLKSVAAVQLGRKGGLKGGPARAASMTPEERCKIAHNAACVRWAQKARASREQRGAG
jgi:hypothetical protein